jgi:hypothetical protein
MGGGVVWATARAPIETATIPTKQIFKMGFITLKKSVLNVG